METNKTNRSLVISSVLLFVFALVGFIDAAYLTVEHYLGVVPPCRITSGCETVLTSSWSQVLGIPVALFGALFYLALVFALIFYFRSKDSRKKEKILRFVALTTIVGFIAEIWFVSLQLFVIKNICFYCMISAATATGLFVVGLFVLQTFFKSKRDNVVSKISERNISNG